MVRCPRCYAALFCLTALVEEEKRQRVGSSSLSVHLLADRASATSLLAAPPSPPFACRGIGIIQTQHKHPHGVHPGFFFPLKSILLFLLRAERNENVRAVRDRSSAVKPNTPPGAARGWCTTSTNSSAVSDTALSQGEGGQGQTAGDELFQTQTNGTGRSVYQQRQRPFDLVLPPDINCRVRSVVNSKK